MDYKTIAQSINKFGYGIFENWSAGSSKKEAVDYAKKSNLKGAKVSLNFLGEKQKEEALVQKTVDEYLNLIKEISKNKIKADVTIKLSQMGFEIPEKGKEVCEKNVRKIASSIKESGLTLWIDMEYAHYIDYTLELYEKINKEFGNTCVAIQANLKRSETDIKRLGNNEKGGCVRLVKGIYPPPPNEGYTKKEEVDESFGRLIDIALSEPKIKVSVATHDEDFIKFSEQAAKKYKKEVEIQMLKGVRVGLQEELIERRINFNIYAPYGQNIFAYGVRRAREAKTGLKNIFIIHGFGWIYDKLH